MAIRIRKGLDLPLTGNPAQVIHEAKKVTSVAIIGDDYPGMKPSMLVQEGDLVKKGQILFECKKNPGVFFTAPLAGKVAAINRGEKRVFKSLVISVQADNGQDSQVQFKSYKRQDLGDLSRESVVEQLAQSGLWTALRQRPFDSIANINETPNSIFVTAMDTRPGAASVELVLSSYMEDFQSGIDVLAHLTPGKIFLCTKAGSKIDGKNLKVEKKEFSGPHPAGNPGTHIHYVDPVSVKKKVWHINYQDVVSIGKLFTKGLLDSEKIISLSGPAVKIPRLLKTVAGANLNELTANELSIELGEVRVISGDVLCGRQVVDDACYLGRYHFQISAISK